MPDPYQSITALKPALRDGNVSPVDLARQCLDRIAALDPQLHAFITVATEHAMAQAEPAAAELRSGHDRGPLHGIPVAVKDLFISKGIRTTAHSPLLRDWVPDYDSTVVARLSEAGAVLIGKLSLHEFADGGATNDPFPAARNPWNTAYSPGGSSSGSGVALAAGLIYGSVGSDTGFSARGPASWCGVVGIKPTYGLVSRAGAFPLSWSLDHMCPMARTVEDCAYVLQAVAGHDPADPTSLDAPVPDLLGHLRDGVAGMRLGVPREWLRVADGLDPDVAAALEAPLGVLRGLGCTVQEVDSTAMIGAAAIHRVIRLFEAYSYHEHTLMTNPNALGPSLRARIIEGIGVRGQPYIEAKQQQAETIKQVSAILSEVDALALPVGPRHVPTFADLESLAVNHYAPPNLANAFNLTGHPGISVPCGFDANRLPVGLQIVGPLLRDDLVLRIAYAYEQATNWKDMHPAL